MSLPDVPLAKPQTDTSGLTDNLGSLLLATKLYVPRLHAELVPRPRLQAQLDRALDVPLTVVVAPAGFGKTTAVVQWLSTKAHPVAWLSLDAQDNDPTTFMRYLVGALQTVAPHVGTTLLALLNAPQPPKPETLITLLINDVAAHKEPLLLVLDDYHVLHATPVHELVRLLVERISPHMHVVVTSREDPPLPLARLRARRHLIELRAAQLRFTLEEAETFLREVMGLAITTEQIMVLEARIEGWVAGLHLVALALQERRDVSTFVSNVTSSHRFVIEYLIEEVLAALPPHLRSFVLHISILERFCAPLCDMVMLGESSEPPYSKLLIDELISRNLFVIPLDDQQQWYRFHHLFGVVVREHLQVGVRSNQIHALHERASQWYEQQHLMMEAIAHAAAATNFSRGADLVEQVAEDVITRGEILMLRQWLKLVPAEYVQSRVRLLLAAAWVSFYEYEHDRMAELLQRAAHLLAKGATDAAERMLYSDHEQLTGELEVLQAWLAVARFENERVIELCNRALSRLPQNYHFVRNALAVSLGIAYDHHGDNEAAVARLTQAGEAATASKHLWLAFDSYRLLASIFWRRGQLRASWEAASRGLELSVVDNQPIVPIAAAAHIPVAWIYYAWNELALAEEHLTKAIEYSRQSGIDLTLHDAYINLAQVLQARGDSAGAKALLHQAADLGLKNTTHWGTFATRVALARGDLDAAAEWARSYGLTIHDPVEIWQESQYHAFAKFLIASGQLDDALFLLDRLLAFAEPAGRMGRVILLEASRSVTLHLQGKHRDAQRTLVRALTIAEPHGHIRDFIDHQQPMFDLLGVLRQNVGLAHLHPFIDRLLAAHSANAQVAPVRPVHSATALLPEPLNERELEVLRLIAQGHSNQQIADRLVVALSTVKWHINNMYGKLQVATRTQALARAAELGLL